MAKKKRYLRTLNEIGKKKYGFDDVSEKQLYFYLCKLYQKRRVERKLEEQNIVRSYLEWKKYVQKKYSQFSKEELVEFSRYLNQRIRNTKPAQEYMKLVFPVIISWIITELFSIIFLDVKPMEFETIGATVAYIVILLFISISSATIFFVYMSGEIWNKSMELTI